MVDNIVLFPLDKIKDKSKTEQNIKENEKAVAKVKKEKTREFVETQVDDMAMLMLRRFVEMGIRTEKLEFTKSLSLLIDILRGMMYKDFDMKHPSQNLIDKLVTVTNGRHGPQAEINYKHVLPEDKNTKPISSYVKEEIKDAIEGWEYFNDDIDTDK